MNINYYEKKNYFAQHKKKNHLSQMRTSLRVGTSQKSESKIKLRDEPKCKTDQNGLDWPVLPSLPVVGAGAVDDDEKWKCCSHSF